MNLAKLYKNGVYDDNMVDLKSAKLSKILKWIDKAQEKRKGGLPVFFGVHLILFSDLSAHIEADCWPPTSGKKVNILGIDKVKL